MPKPDSTQLNSTQSEKQASTMYASIAQATNPDHKQLPDAPPLGLWGPVWRNLRYCSLFWVSAVIILLSIAVAAFPSLLTSVGPSAANLRGSLAPAHDSHPTSFAQQGCDVYARVVHGTHAPVIVDIGVTLAVTVMGIVFGAIADYLGGWADTMLPRIMDMLLTIPLIPAGTVLVQLFTERTVWPVVFVLVVFGWSQTAYVVRSSVILAKNGEHVTASKALGLSNMGILFRHVLPNCLAPVIAMAMTSLDIHIVVEIILPHLSIGLPTTVVSWGNDISVVQQVSRQALSNLFWPVLALVITILGSILVSDALKDSLDPKERRR